MATSICRITRQTGEQAARGRAGSPAARFHLDRRATAPSGEDAVLVLAHLRHGVGKPKAGGDQGERENEGGDVDDHPVPIIVGILAVLELGEIVDRRRQTWTPARSGAPARKSQHAGAALGGRGSLRTHANNIAYPPRRFDVRTAPTNSGIGLCEKFLFRCFLLRQWLLIRRYSPSV